MKSKIIIKIRHEVLSCPKLMHCKILRKVPMKFFHALQSSHIFSLYIFSLVSMKKKMEEREKIWEPQQKIREEFLEADFKRMEQRWEQILKQRDEKWKEEIERRERELMQRLDTKIKTFYNERLKRDEDVLSFLEKREEKMEVGMLQKA